MKLFNKLLIANRGEIAIRIMRTAHKLGIKTIAVYADDDIDSLHVSMADEAFSLGGGTIQDTYLNIPKILEIAKKAQADALHPGYGFLAENADLVKSVEDLGITFIGPSVDAMFQMGDKIRAREIAEKARVPITKGIVGSPDEIMEQISNISFPVLVKASAGGGGKGMRIVHHENKLKDALEATSREALNYFGDGTVYVEKYLENPRHIEIQILADKYGNAVYLFERECSIQRRYQKIIEEAPSPTLSDDLRSKMGNAAVLLVQKIGYYSAGTIEFLVDKNLDFYFLEMNTRIQVEHPVSELISGKDIVEEQLYIAKGEKLRFKQEDLSIDGHAIECRIYAENPEKDFLPSPGKIINYKEPLGDFIRVDSSLNSPQEIKSQYDPMIAKLIVHSNDRQTAISKMQSALDNYIIQGINTNISYLTGIMQDKNYLKNNISTKFCDNHSKNILQFIEQSRQKWLELAVSAFYTYSINNNKDVNSNVWQYIGFWRNVMNSKVMLDKKEFNFYLQCSGKSTYRFEFENGKKIDLEQIKVDGNELSFKVDTVLYKAYISETETGKAFIKLNGFEFIAQRKDCLYDSSDLSASVDFSLESGSGKIVSPMPGKVIKINVKEGDSVHKGDVLLIVEAMKMENSITCPKDGTVEVINTKLNEMVDGHKELIKLREL